MNGFLAKNIAWNILVPALLLLIISLTVLFSINPAYFRSQLVFGIVSILAFLLFSQIEFKLLVRYTVPMYVASVVILLILLVIGIESRGAMRWVEFFGVRAQFSEILKPFLLLSLAGFLARRPATFKTFVVVLLALAPLLILIIKQPDLGSALIYAFTVLLTLLAAGFPFYWFGLGFLGIALIMPILWRFLLEYQRQRILTFFFSSRDPLGASYNAIQATIAVGSGGFMGKGLSLGTQSSLKFLPEHHTDFIFATLSESLGFVGSLVLLVCMLVLLWNIFKIAAGAQDKFAKLFAISAFFLIFVQFFVNVGMNIGVVPIVGVTLPFVSYGGSSLLSNFIILGILSSFAKERRFHEVIAIR